MQVMGATAHEDGLPLNSLKDLFIPGVGLKHGTIQLAQLFERYQFSPAAQMTHAVSAYNAGSARLGKGGKYLNQDYVDRVMGKYREFKG
jgi:soluble lytic murein transglycosylase-like protein